MAPVAPGTNALNLLYPPFMRSLIPFRDIAFICLPYHHYFSSDWCSHEISLAFWRANPPSPPSLSHSPPRVTRSLGHLWSLQESLCLSSDHPLSVTEHIGLLILPGAILEKKKKKIERKAVRKWQPERVGERWGIYHTIINPCFFFSSLDVTRHFSPSRPRPQRIKPMEHFSPLEFDFAHSYCQNFFLFFFPFLLNHIKEMGAVFYPHAGLNEIYFKY